MSMFSWQLVTNQYNSLSLTQNIDIFVSTHNSIYLSCFLYFKTTRSHSVREDNETTHIKISKPLPIVLKIKRLRSKEKSQRG